MRIDGKVADKYVILCDKEHAFVVERLGISVQCPECGECALSAELATDFVLTQAAERRPLMAVAGGPD